MSQLITSALLTDLSISNDVSTFSIFLNFLCECVIVQKTLNEAQTAGSGDAIDHLIASIRRLTPGSTRSIEGGKQLRGTYTRKHVQLSTNVSKRPGPLMRVKSQSV